MNEVHQAKQTDWDLRVPVVRWAYMTMSKNRSVEAIPTLMSGDETIRAEKNPHTTALAVRNLGQYARTQVKELCNYKKSFNEGT